LDWLRLIRSKNIGATTFHELIRHFSTVSAAIEALPELARQGGRRAPRSIVSRDEADIELEQARKIGARLICLGERGYPQRLAAIEAPPPVLYVKGRLQLADVPMVAIVGARNGSAVGQKFTRTIAADLGQIGFAIASGLARGIDTAAHKASLETGTVAVLAGGLGSVYPPENEDLQNKIGEVGLLVSERPPTFKPAGRDFPRRNRLISGVAAAIVVVEAAKRSGSLITARYAGEQGREVLAVPGHPLDPRAAGTNRLIQDGAGLITCVDDIASVLAPILGATGESSRERESLDVTDDRANTPSAELDGSSRQQVVDALGVSPVDVDELIRMTGLPAGQVQIVLLELDLAGRLERHGHQLVSRKDAS
jgi:DNA processing protein